MKLTWRRRAIVLVAAWLGVVGVMALLGMDPRPVLLAAIAATIGATLCLMLDVSDVAKPATWHVGRGVAPLQRGSDFRIGLLQRQLLNAPERSDSVVLHDMLVDLIDGRLMDGHGIDRRADRARATNLLGPQLVDFIDRPPSPKQIADPRYLSNLLSHIEAL